MLAVGCRYSGSTSDRRHIRRHQHLRELPGGTINRVLPYLDVQVDDCCPMQLRLANYRILSWVNLAHQRQIPTTTATRDKSQPIIEFYARPWVARVGRPPPLENGEFFFTIGGVFSLLFPLMGGLFLHVGAILLLFFSTWGLFLVLMGSLLMKLIN